MRSFAIRPRLLVVALFLSLGGIASAQDNLRTLRNPHFETVGLDLRSVNYINDLTAIVVEISQRYLESEGLAYPMPILVNLRPEEHFDFEGDHQISMGPRGSVQLDLRWEEPLSLERTCYLLTDALLVQYAIFNFGPGAEANLPLWPISGLSSEVYLRLRPSAFMDRAALAKSMPLPSSAEVLFASQENPKAASLGFWMLHALKGSSADRATVQNLFQLSLTGTDITEALTAAVQSQSPIESPISLEDWWAAQMQKTLSREYEVVESMETTRLWLHALADFSQPIKVGEEALAFNLRSLWKHRDTEEVRELVGARYEILKLRLVRANPAYYNPAQSLGTLYEVLLREDSAYRYLHALTIYLSDWEDAKDMQVQLNSMLSSDR